MYVLIQFANTALFVNYITIVNECYNLVTADKIL